jgi:phage terminase large subunit-like protein
VRSSPSADARAQRRIDWIERFCCHVKGEWAGNPLILGEWERDIVRAIFGPADRQGLRRVRKALIGVPRKNGKSTLGAALALNLLFADDEPGVEVYSVAADREQARIVFGIACQMVEAGPLAKYSKVRRHWIEVPRLAGLYRVLSADAPTKHGLNPHGVIFDELHAQKNRELWDVMTSGSGARRQPLTVAITTAGHDRETVCWEQFDYGRKVSSGVISDPSFVFRWWGADEDAPWDNPETWQTANPNYGVSVSPKFLESEARQVKHTPARQNMFRRLYLNQWTQAETRWLDLAAWDWAAGMRIDEAGLRGRECFGGLDLASTTDLAALCWVFPDDDAYQAVWRLFAPQGAIDDLDRRTAGMASVWAREGWLTLTSGDVIDYAAIHQTIDRDIVELGFQPRRLAFDRWGSPIFVQALADHGLEVAATGQGFASMSPPTKELERLILDRRFWHGGNPVLRWMADNVVVRTDPAGNLKPDKERSGDKIDGIVAAIMALDAAMRSEPVRRSAYEDRGMETA